MFLKNKNKHMFLKNKNKHMFLKNTEYKQTYVSKE